MGTIGSTTDRISGSTPLQGGISYVPYTPIVSNFPALDWSGTGGGAIAPSYAPYTGGVTATGTGTGTGANAYATAETGPINISVPGASNRFSAADALGLFNSFKSEPPPIPGIYQPGGFPGISAPGPMSLAGPGAFNPAAVRGPVGTGIAPPQGAGGGMPGGGGRAPGTRIIPQGAVGGGGGTPFLPGGLANMMKAGPPAQQMLQAKATQGQLAGQPGSQAMAARPIGSTRVARRTPQGGVGSAAVPPVPQLVSPPPPVAPDASGFVDTPPTPGFTQTWIPGPNDMPVQPNRPEAVAGQAPMPTQTPQMWEQAMQNVADGIRTPVEVDQAEIQRIDGMINRAQAEVDKLAQRQALYLRAYDTPELRRKYNQSRAKEAKDLAYQSLDDTEQLILSNPGYGAPAGPAPLRPWQIGQYLRNRNPVYARATNPQAEAWQKAQIEQKQAITKHYYDLQKDFLEQSLADDTKENATRLTAAQVNLEKLVKDRLGATTKDIAERGRNERAATRETGLNQRFGQKQTQQQQQFDRKEDRYTRAFNAGELHKTIADDVKNGNLTAREAANVIAQQNANTAARNAATGEGNLAINQALAPVRAAQSAAAAGRDRSIELLNVTKDGYSQMMRDINPEAKQTDIDKGFGALQQKLYSQIQQQPEYQQQVPAPPRQLQPGELQAQVDNTFYRSKQTPAEPHFKNNEKVGRAGGVDRVMQPGESDDLAWWRSLNEESRLRHGQQFKRKYGYDPADVASR